MSEMRPATLEDLPALARTLAEAFADDPVWTWMLPPARHDERLHLIFAAILRHAIPSGHVYTAGDCQAVAIWAPPNEWKLPFTAMMRATPSIARAAGLRLPRLLGRLNTVESAHKKQPPGHWYLEYIGAGAQSRGTGLGSALLTDALSRTDAAGLPVYLESSNPRNLSFYERHGFTVTKQLDLRNGPPQWLLWRNAVT